MVKRIAEIREEDFEVVPDRRIDTKTCFECGGEMRIVAAILETKVIVSILTHLKLPARPPPIDPPQIQSQGTFSYD